MSAESSLWARLFRRRKAPPFRRQVPTQAPSSAQASRRADRTPEGSSIEEGTALTQAIEQMLELKLDEMSTPNPPSDELQALAERIINRFKATPPQLDAFPQASMRVLQLVAEPDVTYRKLGAIIVRDPALSAMVIKVANSAFYQGVQEIRSIHDAMSRLGLQEIARIVGIIGSRSLFDARVASERNLFASQIIRLRSQAITTAIAASALSIQNREGQPDRAFMGGILHDVGKSLRFERWRGWCWTRAW